MQRDLHVIVGMGATGLSCAEYLSERGISFAIMDTRSQPPQQEAFQKMYPDVQVVTGRLDSGLLDRAEKIILSPGVSLKEPAIARQLSQGIPVVGDIELFLQATKKPIIAITGTNAKSTVTTLVGLMVEAAGFEAGVGGNLGTPALALLKQESAEVYVLELSSFQLETTYSLAAHVATVLNITPDHMDRYDTLEDYRQAKLRVYNHCQVAVCNRDDPLTDCGSAYSVSKVQFTLQAPQANEFGLVQHNNETYLAHGGRLLLPVRELPVLGKHYQANVLAALAIGHSFGLPYEPMLETLKAFKGLAHRCQLVRERHHVSWYNDSKGTNVGATLAAIEGLGSEIKGKVVLIAGGVGKNADFSPLLPALQKYVRSVVLIGEAARDLADTVSGQVDYSLATSMEEAVLQAGNLAQPGDSVLLSPACASFDMFKNYEHRGDVFAQIVERLS